MHSVILLSSDKTEKQKKSPHLMEKLSHLTVITHLLFQESCIYRVKQWKISSLGKTIFFNTDYRNKTVFYTSVCVRVFLVCFASHLFCWIFVAHRASVAQVISCEHIVASLRVKRKKNVWYIFMMYCKIFNLLNQRRSRSHNDVRGFLTSALDNTWQWCELWWNQC